MLKILFLKISKKTKECYKTHAQGFNGLNQNKKIKRKY